MMMVWPGKGISCLLFGDMCACGGASGENMKVGEFGRTGTHLTTTFEESKGRRTVGSGTGTMCVWLGLGKERSLSQHGSSMASIIKSSKRLHTCLLHAI